MVPRLSASRSAVAPPLSFLSAHRPPSCTGRGSAYGCKPAPSLKLATNTALWNRQEEDMDINCGVIVDGKASVQEVGQQIFELILKTASGQPSKSEIFGYGDDEFAPWVLGPTM